MLQKPETEKIIFHIDLDAYYASVEVQRNKELKGQPVVVGADPKSGSGRGVVMTCSYEARKFGIKSAMAISRAYELCPDAVFVRPDMKLYKTVSIRVMDFLRQFADKFQQTSIDECYMDVTETVNQYNSPIDLAKHIQQELLKQEGLTCSIGISPNKPVSKIASDFKKPNGITFVEADKIREFLAPLHVNRISGVGKKTQERLNAFDIKLIGDIQARGLEFFENHLGKYGKFIWRIANGKGSNEISEYRNTKSISAERTFSSDIDDLELISEKIQEITTTIHSHLQRSKYLYKTITLKIRFEDFSTFTRSKSLGTYSNDKETIIYTIYRLFEQFKNSKKKIRLIGIRLSTLSKLESRQQSLMRWV